MKQEKSTLLLEKEVEKENKKTVSKASIKKEVHNLEQSKNIVIETPNYDFIPEATPEKKKRLLKLEKEVEKSMPRKTSWIKRSVLALGIALTLSFGIYTAVDLSNSISAYNTIQNEYSINVATLMQKIASVDSGNKMSELIETFPDELMRPSEFEIQSNWFDRFCNFLSGLFGG